MDDIAGPPTPPQAENINPEPVEPISQVPPEQEYQSANPAQVGQTTSPVSATPADQQISGPSPAIQPAKEGEEEKKEEVTASTSIGDLIKDAFFVADDIGEPQVNADNPRQIHFYYPDDESMVILRLEGRPGKWQGLSPIAHSEQDRERANKNFDQQKKVRDDRAAELKKLAGQESHDDASARRQSKPESVDNEATPAAEQHPPQNQPWQPAGTQAQVEEKPVGASL